MFAQIGNFSQFGAWTERKWSLKQLHPTCSSSNIISQRRHLPQHESSRNSQRKLRTKPAFLSWKPHIVGQEKDSDFAQKIQRKSSKPSEFFLQHVYSTKIAKTHQQLEDAWSLVGSSCGHGPRLEYKWGGNPCREQGHLRPWGSGWRHVPCLQFKEHGMCLVNEVVDSRSSVNLTTETKMQHDATSCHTAMFIRILTFYDLQCGHCMSFISLISLSFHCDLHDCGVPCGCLGTASHFPLLSSSIGSSPRRQVLTRTPR